MTKRIKAGEKLIETGLKNLMREVVEKFLEDNTYLLRNVVEEAIEDAVGKVLEGEVVIPAPKGAVPVQISSTRDIFTEEIGKLPLGAPSKDAIPQIAKRLTLSEEEVRQRGIIMAIFRPRIERVAATTTAAAVGTSPAIIHGWEDAITLLLEACEDQWRRGWAERAGENLRLHPTTVRRKFALIGGSDYKELPLNELKGRAEAFIALIRQGKSGNDATEKAAPTSAETLTRVPLEKEIKIVEYAISTGWCDRWASRTAGHFKVTRQLVKEVVPKILGREYFLKDKDELLSDLQEYEGREKLQGAITRLEERKAEKAEKVKRSYTFLTPAAKIAICREAITLAWETKWLDILTEKLGVARYNVYSVLLQVLGKGYRKKDPKELNEILTNFIEEKSGEDHAGKN